MAQVDAAPVKHELLLMPKHRGAPVLSVTWDDEAGTVEGRGADKIESMLAMYARHGGGPTIHPYPCSHQLSEAPLRSHTDMAALLAESWHLPAFLAAVLPTGDFDPPDGADELTDY